MVAGLTDGCDMRCQRQLAVDDDAKVASRSGDSDARAEHQECSTHQNTTRHDIFCLSGLLFPELVRVQEPASEHRLTPCLAGFLAENLPTIFGDNSSAL